MKRRRFEEKAVALYFEKCQGEFSIDARGTTANDIQDGLQVLLSNFVKVVKVVVYFYVALSYNLFSHSLIY